MSLLGRLLSRLLSKDALSRLDERKTAQVEKHASYSTEMPVSRQEHPTGFFDTSGLVSHRVRSSEIDASNRFTIPSPAVKQMPSPMRWLNPGESIEVHGLTITRGMIYVGSDSDANEPSLIDPKLSVNSHSAGRSMPCTSWPSYAIMSAGTRYGYLQWLSNGAKDTNVQIGFVFVYFYGIERRLLLDAEAAELELLHAEIDRLLSIYGADGSLRNHGQRLKEFTRVRHQLSEIPNELPSVDASFNYELPIALRLGLGCFARDGRPLPSEWALLWAISNPLISRRTPVRRCPDAFARAFAHVYRDAHGEGLILPQNKSKLKLHYSPASAALKDQNFQTKWDDIPDVMAVTGPNKKLQALVEEATCLIDPYSRFIGRHKDKGNTLEAQLTLPAFLWPDRMAQKIGEMRNSIVKDMKPTPCGKVFGGFGCTVDPTANMVCDLANALQQSSIGMEPDVLAGAKKPTVADMIVFFPLAMQGKEDRATAEYRSASLTVALSAAMALADGEASDAELQFVEKRIATWTHLDADLQMRLRAQYRLQVCQPASLSTLKAKIASVSPEKRLELGLALASLAKADGVVSAAEVKLLEQLYRTLQLDPQLVYTHLHGDRDQQTSTSTSGDKSGKQRKYDLSLDSDRVARLQCETEKVSALLATVFAEEEIAEPPQSSHSATLDKLREPEADHETVPSPLPRLDRQHTAFLVLLLTRPVWSREELVAAAADMQVMLDGALERINDAALDVSGNLLIEGDDPVYIDKSILETVAA